MEHVHVHTAGLCVAILDVMSFYNDFYGFAVEGDEVDTLGGGNVNVAVSFACRHSHAACGGDAVALARHAAEGDDALAACHLHGAGEVAVYAGACDGFDCAGFTCGVDCRYGILFVGVTGRGKIGKAEAFNRSGVDEGVAAVDVIAFQRQILGSAGGGIEGYIVDEYLRCTHRCV